jgi:hypothetical protein
MYLLALGLALIASRTALAQLPPNWADQDIGSPSLPGSASYSNGIFTESGGGLDIWNNADQFHFAYNAFGGSAILALVNSIQNTDPWAKAGVMFRDTLDPAAMFADVVITPGNGVSFQWRNSTSGSCGLSQVTGITAPIWVKLVQAGTDFTASYSADGLTWNQIGSDQIIPMNNTPLAGLAVTAHNDTLLATATFANVTISNAPPPPSVVFGIYRELWTGLDSSLGNTLTALTNTTDNPNWPDNPDPAYTKVFTTFETEVNTGMNYYGQRLRAFVVPPTNGNYTFWISSDDTSQLFLSTDEGPLNKGYIAGVATWTSSRQWTKEANQQSAPIALEGGRRYYIEAIMQQGTGGDNLAARWELPDGSFEEPMQAASSPGTLMIPFTGLDSEPAIYQQTTNVTVVEGYNAYFSVLATNEAPVSYQWYLNGNALTGPLALKPFYWVSNASIAINNGQVYTCAVSNSVDVISSAPMTLSVIADTVPPKALSALNLGTNGVQIVFSKPVEAASATNLANFVFTNGLPISGASLASDKITVVLKTAPLVYGSNYTILISGVRDRASTPNTIAANSPVSFTALPYVPQDIGSPSIPSAVILTANGLDITAAGSDIGGQSDQFNLSYQLRSGDFDVSVQLAGLTPSDAWAKAGLMARETLSPNSRFAASLATPSMTGCLFEWRDPASSLANLAGRFPVNYPNTWLRLKRSGNLFTGFAGYDGLTWTVLGSATIALPSQLYVGLVASSHDTNLATTAVFGNVANVTNAVLGTVPNPHEPLGPCSRLTPFVISEIMYKPAPRTDGNNVEFIELYNTNPYFEDLSGFQIAGSISYTFPAGTILAGGAFLVLAASPPAIQNVYGITNVLGPYTGALKKSGTIELIDAQGGIVLTVPYSNLLPWPVAADGTGHSLVLANPTFGEGDPRAWDISDVVGGSPGQADSFRPNPLRSVLINEVLAHSENPNVLQFIELYNHSNQTNDLSGCILTDDPATNKFVVPPGTRIGPGGFVSFNQTQLGFNLNGAGGTVYFIKSDGSRVLDAVQFAPEADGVSYGRWPDGATDFYPLVSRTPGTNNSAIWIGDVVINELMYAPISANDDDQYIELYNKGSNTVSLANWQFTSGISYIFPLNVTLAPNSYLVLARNQTNLFGKYPNLNTANTLGNYGGKLSHKGERLALAMPQLLTVNSSNGVTTNTIYVVEDEVTYAAGGRWGQWSHGGGSSLELVNPNTNHRLAYNWADSDETTKSAWTNIEFTGVLDNGANYNGGVVDLVQVGLMDVGECLVDNIEVLPGGPAGANIVSNGSFESGLSPWVPYGDHVRSSLETALGGYQSATSLHLRSSDSVWTLGDYVQGVLTDTSLAAGQTATLRLKARWLRGWPEILMRLRGNWLDVAGAMPLPSNLGTPGLPNSRAVSNPGPAIYEINHSPALPAANQPVVVSARFHDLAAFKPTLLYRVDSPVFNPTPAYTSVPMVDSGTAGDALAADGIYSATIPAQAAGTVVAFLVQASDTSGATTVFPQILNNNAGAPRECVVAVGDPIPTGSFSHHHVFITYNWAQLWSQGGGVSHEVYDGTWVDGGGRIVYDWTGRYAGSPYHQYLSSPVTTVGGMHWLMPDDDQVFGTASFNKQHVPGNGPLDDNTLQREQTAYWMARQIGLRFQNRRYYFYYVNGVRHAPLMEDSQVPDAQMLKQFWPNDNNGMLYKNHSWFEGDVAPQSNAYMSFNNMSWCYLGKYTTTINGVPNEYKTARYRWMWWVRQYQQSANDFSQVYALIDAANTPVASPAYYANMESQVDTEEWLRLSAMEHATGDWDSFFTQNQWNMYCYKPTMGKWTALKWDWNITLGSGTQTWPPDGSQLFNFTVYDPIMAAFQTYPAYQRAYLRALQDIANLAMNNALVNPVLDAKYAAFAANGLAANAAYGLQVLEPGASGLKNWIGTMHNSILTALVNQGVSNVPFALNSEVVNNNVAVISGTAPLQVKTVWFNGVEFPLTWNSLTSWTTTVPLRPGTNQFSVVGVDLHSQPVAGSSNTVLVVYSGGLPSPAGQVVLNEIMYNPVVAGAQYVELYNASPSITFDMSGWQLPGLGYSFPSGSLIGPNGFQVLAANRSAFSSAYGGTIPIFDEFNGSLSANGQNIFLVQPGTNSASNLTVAAVRYGAASPWPPGANGSGSSLQLIDPHQDNWRAGNWAGGFPPASLSPGAPNTVLASLPAFPPLWLNELQADNLTGITNSAGQHVPWLELFNPTATAVSLSGLYLSTNYANLSAWSFPVGATINPGEFKVIFADAQTSLSTPTQLHTSFTLSSGSGSLALSRLYNGQPQVLDYIDYANLGPNHSYGSVPDGQSFLRQEFAFATPGATNNPTSPASFIAYTSPGAVYTQNFDSLPDPGATSVNTANPVTINGITYSLANPFSFADPVVASGNSGGLGISELAGWYGLADLTSKFGATDGDQTTGGQLSFGLPSNSNRALGLLATSSTGGTAFGAKFINQTPQNLSSITVQFTGELWRQSNLPKTLACYYFIDPTGVAPFSSSQTALLPNLNVNFPVSAADVGGTAVDGTASVNQTNLSPVNQTIANWPPGAALWLVWQMTDPTGKAQGLAIDNLSFSASTQTSLQPLPLSFQTTATNLVLSWIGAVGETYQVEYKDDLGAGTWTPLGTPVAGTGAALSITNDFTNSSQRFYRLEIMP